MKHGRFFGFGYGLAALGLVGCWPDNSANGAMTAVEASTGDDPTTESPPPSLDAQAAHDATSSGGDAQANDAASSGSDDSPVTPTDASASTDGDSGGPTNLVTNGNFAQGTMFWSITGTATMSVTGNQLCVMAQTSEVTLGWTPTASLALSTSSSYTLSYEASASVSAVTISAKVGETASPYTADFGPVMDAATTSAQTFTHPFTPEQADPSAGLAFTFTSSAAQNVCFENVSLVQD